MPLSILAKIRRHAAVASGNFAAIFRELEIPPLPEAVARLIAEINQPEPDIGRLVQVISSSTELAARVVKTVNSSLFALPRPVTSVKHATTLLGLRHIRSIALGYATIQALPKPRGDVFNQGAFFTDSVLRAILSRTLSKRRFRDLSEDAFTASLLADVALPVLLSAWGEYYEPVVQEWKHSPKRLSAIEREHFGWDHAQAGAWIVQSWGLPEEMVCFVGAHNLSWEELCEHMLEDTIGVPISVAALTPSVLKPDPARLRGAFGAATKQMSVPSSEFVDAVTEVGVSFGEISELFGFSDRNAASVLDGLVAAAGAEEQGE